MKMKKETFQLPRLGICFGLIMASLFLVSLSAEFTTAAEKPIELTFATFYPPPPMGMGVTLTEFTKEIEKRTAGRVKVTNYFGGTLLKPAEVYEGIVKGVADMGHSVLSYNPGRFPLMEVCDLPGYPPTVIGELTSRVANDIYKKFRPAELADTQVLFLNNFIPGNIDSRKPIRTLEDIKGLRVRATGTGAKTVELLGGVPVAMPMPETYDALKKNVVDAALSNFESLFSYKMTEVTKYTTLCSRVGYTVVFFVVMNRNKWNSLPKDIQGILTEVSEEYIDKAGKTWTDGDQKGYEYGKKSGQVYISLPPEEEIRWIDRVVKPIEKDYVERMQAKGLPGKELLDYKHELVNKYSKVYPSRIWGK